MHHRLAVLALVGLATLTGHTIGHGGWSAWTTGRSAGHGYLEAAAALAVPAAVVAFAWLAVRTARHSLQALPTVRFLASAAAGLYVVQEAVEHAIVNGAGLQILSEPPFWLGLLAQPLVALVLVLLLRVGRSVARVLLATSPVPRLAPAPRRLPALALVPVNPVVTTAWVRGPPNS